MCMGCGHLADGFAAAFWVGDSGQTRLGAKLRTMEVTPRYEGDDPERPIPFIATTSKDAVMAPLRSGESVHGSRWLASLGCGRPRSRQRVAPYTTG